MRPGLLSGVCTLHRSCAGFWLCEERCDRPARMWSWPFLEGPCLYSELAGLPSRRWGLVVSERLQVAPRRLIPDWKRVVHRLADYVTTNSHANRVLLEEMVPALRGKIATIYNCLDLGFFAPGDRPKGNAPNQIRLVAAASYQERKNTLGLINAVAMARAKLGDTRLVVDWYGGIPFLLQGRPDTRYFEEVQKAIGQLSLTDQFRVHPAEQNILEQYQSADAVVLPSFNEGLPNTVCEGMACGCPILASRIGDAELLVRSGRNGFLFDPGSAESMARALVDFCGLSRDEEGGDGEGIEAEGRGTVCAGGGGCGLWQVARGQRCQDGWAGRTLAAECELGTCRG